MAGCRPYGQRSEDNVTTALATNGNGTAEIMERVLLAGDLAKLSPADRVTYYARVCESLGLNPLTKPFDYLQLSGRLVLYANRTATDQLREQRGISLTITSRDSVGDVYVVTVRAVGADGRTDESTGVVSLDRLGGDALANALMKAETKAKRRVTLSICGLGWMDETETETVPQARRIGVDPTTGEVIEDAPRRTVDALPAGDSGPALACEECGSELRETRFKDGSVWDPAHLANFGRGKYGRVLCMAHYRAAKQAREQAVAEPSPPPAKTARDYDELFLGDDEPPRQPSPSKRPAVA